MPDLPDAFLRINDPGRWDEDREDGMSAFLHLGDEARIALIIDLLMSSENREPLNRAATSGALRSAWDSEPYRNGVRLPLYGVEQLCGDHLLARVGDPTFELLKGRTSVTSDSLEGMIFRLGDARCGSIEPADAVSLSMASRRIGGRAKPWASIFGALLSGETPFWLDGDAPTTMTIRVRPADFAAFDLIDDFVVAPWINSSISQADAAELLNIKSAVVSSLAPGLGLPFSLSGRMLAADRNTAEHIAAAVAWDMEISWHLGIRFDKVEAALTARGIARLATGWCRNELIAEGILPQPTLSASRMTDSRVLSAAAIGVQIHASDCHAA